jgi:hypothetical protein
MAGAAETPQALACRHVYRKFKDLEGVKPSLQRAGPNRVYTFKRKLDGGPGGARIMQVVRVTISPEGRVLKLVASR